MGFCVGVWVWVWVLKKKKKKKKTQVAPGQNEVTLIKKKNK